MASVNLPNPPAISVSVGPNALLLLGDSLRLNAVASPSDPGYTYAWQPALGLSCPTCPDPVARPDTATLYRLTITNANGCTATDELLLQVRIGRDVYFPNAFSPNADNANDIWMPYAGSNVDLIRELVIFNRWGEPVFYVANFPPNDPRYGWDGAFHSRPAPIEVYAFTALVRYKDGKERRFEGGIMLMR
jgi:gliding motility-associated-like protein